VRPPAGKPAMRDDLPRAVSYMLLVALFIPTLNASAKFLAATYPTIEVVWARYAGHFVYMVIMFAPRFGTRLLATSRPFAQVTRAGMLCTSTLIYVLALPHVQLTTATAISFTGPFIVTALAPLVLKERVGWARWLFVAAGFIGALVILRPGTGAVSPAAFLLIASATASALYQILSRKLATVDRVETANTYTGLVGFVLTTTPLPFFWVTPHSARDALIFVGLGFFGGLGHYFLQRAFELAPAPFVSPFNYLGLIGAALFSFIVFGELPDIWVWVGAAIIAGSGIFMLYYEHKSRLRSRRN
jgi:drug/metabolite transporter (DMT)-like permease